PPARRGRPPRQGITQGPRRLRPALLARQLAPPPRLPRHPLRLAARLPRRAHRSGRELHDPRLSPHRPAQRPRRQHRPRLAGDVRAAPEAPRARRRAALVGDVLVARQPAEPGRARDRPGADGPRLRVGDVDDAADRAAAGARAREDAAGPIRQGLQPRDPGVDHQGPHRAGPHRRPAPGQRRKGRGAVPPFRRRRRQAAGARPRLGRKGMGRMNGELSARPASWRYTVCGLLLCATMLLYMDRLTLSVLAKRICDDYGFTNEQFGALDTGLSYAFAAGAFFFGFLVDRVGPRWLYPAVLVAWSSAGIATAYSDVIGAWLRPAAAPGEQAYFGFMLCRVALGFFESGHWPCALVTTQVILTRADRSLGNSILQGGAALGTIVTSFIVLGLVTDAAGGWRPPFTAIGCLG